MQQSLLDRLVELMKLENREEWERLCHHAYATQPKVTCWTRGRRRLRVRDLPTAKDWLDQLANLPSRSPEKAARKCYRRGDPRASTDTLLTDWLCWNCVQFFADAYRNQMVGRTKGSLERKPLDPALITAETLRFDADELELDGGKLVIVDVRIEPAPAPLPSPSAPPVRKPVMKVRQPPGRPREIDRDAITGVATDCAKKGVEEFLDRFVERVSHECGERRPPVRTPKSRSDKRDICRPIWDAARGKITQK
jgi:hypothetical protein